MEMVSVSQMGLHTTESVTHVGDELVAREGRFDIELAQRVVGEQLDIFPQIDRVMLVTLKNGDGRHDETGVPIKNHALRVRAEGDSQAFRLLGRTLLDETGDARLATRLDDGGDRRLLNRLIGLSDD
jgi:hypothetical protein